MTDENFELLKSRSNKDLEVHEDNVLETSLNMGKLYNSYLQLYSREIYTLKEMNVELDKTYGELYHKYKFGKDFDYALTNKGEVDVYINNDPLYYNYLKFVRKQEVIVKFLEQHLDNLSKMSYHIKNYVEIKKLRMGVM